MSMSIFQRNAQALVETNFNTDDLPEVVGMFWGQMTEEQQYAFLEANLSDIDKAELSVQWDVDEEEEDK